VHHIVLLLSTQFQFLPIRLTSKTCLITEHFSDHNIKRRHALFTRVWTRIRGQSELSGFAGFSPSGVVERERGGRNAVPPNILLKESRSPTYYQDMGERADTVAFPPNMPAKK